MIKSVILVFSVLLNLTKLVSPSCDGCGIIVDTDMGGDDAMAVSMLIQKQKFEGPGKWGPLLAITTVSGNTGANNVTRNAKVLLSALNTSVPIIEGGINALAGYIEPTYYFGYDGFGDYLPPLKPNEATKYVKTAIYLAETVRQYPGKITLACIGPLTNLALALHINVEFMDQIRHIFILGGDYQGTSDVPGVPGVEANVYMDPEAADFFFSLYSSYDKVTIIPNEAVLTADYPMEFRTEKLGKIGGNLMDLLNKGERIGVKLDLDTWYAYDQSLIALVLDESIGTYVPARVVVETQGPRGAMFALLQRNNSNVNLVTKLNRTAITKILLKYLRS